MRVLLVEDNGTQGSAIKRILDQEAYVVDWVKNGVEAWNYLKESEVEYRVGIFDWQLPDVSGLDLIKRLRKENNPLPILILTGKDKYEDRVTGLDAGADDYLMKPFNREELLARVRALLRRSPQLQPQELTVGLLSLDYKTNHLFVLQDNGEKEELELTAKEFLLMEYFMRHPHHILTSDRLLTQLWEMDAEPNSNVVAAQIRLLRRKLKTLQLDKSLETVYGLGYRFNPSLIS